MAHMVAETGAAVKVSGPALFGMGDHQDAFRGFLNSNFQPQPQPFQQQPGSCGGAAGSNGAIGAAAQNGGGGGNSNLYASSSSEPASPQRALPIAGKALSADVISAGRADASPPHANTHAAGANGAAAKSLAATQQHDSASSTDLRNGGGSGSPVDEEAGTHVNLPPPLAKNRFGAFARRLQVCWKSLARAWKSGHHEF